MARPQDRGRLVVQQPLRSKVAVKLWELSEAGRPPVPVRVSAVAVQSEASRLATASPHLLVRYRAKDEAQKSEVNLESIDLQRRRLRLLAEVQAKREVEESEDKAPMVNPVGSPEVAPLLVLSAARDNRNAERKKAKGLHRQDRNQSG